MGSWSTIFHLEFTKTSAPLDDRLVPQEVPDKYPFNLLLRDNMQATVSRV